MKINKICIDLDGKINRHQNMTCLRKMMSKFIVGSTYQKIKQY